MEEELRKMQKLFLVVESADDGMIQQPLALDESGHLPTGGILD